MNRRSHLALRLRLSGQPAWSRLLPLISAGCLLALTGCQSGTDSFLSSIKSPFQGAKKPSPESPSLDVGPSAEASELADREKAPFARQMVQARGMERSRDYTEAQAAYEQIISEYPERYEPYHRLAVMADRQKRYREAQGLYEQAIRLEPRNPDLFNDLGYCLFLQGKLDKAEAAMLKAVTLSPANARYRNNLGMVYGHEGRYEEALGQFRLAGSEADAYYNLAFVLSARNEIEDAKNCFRLSLAADPTYEPALQALRSFEEYEQDPVGAARESDLAQDGIRWVPYLEGAETETMDTHPASHTAPSTSGRLVPSTRPSTQGQLRRARSLMTERIQTGAE